MNFNLQEATNALIGPVRIRLKANKMGELKAAQWQDLSKMGLVGQDVLAAFAWSRIHVSLQDANSFSSEDQRLTLCTKTLMVETQNRWDRRYLKTPVWRPKFDHIWCLELQDATKSRIFAFLVRNGKDWTWHLLTKVPHEDPAYTTTLAKLSDAYMRLDQAYDRDTFYDELIVDQ